MPELDVEQKQEDVVDVVRTNLLAVGEAAKALYIATREEKYTDALDATFELLLASALIHGSLLNAMKNASRKKADG